MKNLLNRMPDLALALAEQVGARQIQRMCDIFLVLPVVVIMTVFGLYLTLWRIDPLIRIAHMLWVLGSWMLGTIGMFAFIIPARLKLGFPFPILFFTSIAIVLAIYFTPLFRFTALFSNPPDLFLALAIGFVTGMSSWLLVLRYRTKISVP